MKDDNFSFKAFLKLISASLVLGTIGGGVGAAFSHLIGLVTELRTANDWLLYLLPLCGVAIVFLYKKLGIYGQGTNQVLETEKLSPFLSVGVFITAALSHLFGASVGREGAALQMGGSLAVVCSKLLHIDNELRGVLVRAGMAAVFSAVFGTPIAAFIFALEVVCVGTLHLKSVLPSLIASFTAFGVAHLMGVHTERFLLTTVPDFSLDTAFKIAVLTLCTSFLSIGFCYSLRYSVRFAKFIIKNPYLRIAIGGIAVILLTIIVGNRDYNGAGTIVIERIFKSGFNNPNSISISPLAFALKLIFTCISVAAGFKGGEIVPTLFIGATFGALLSSLLGLSVPFGAALCMVLLFCGVTNSPLASIALSAELFSGVGFWYFVPTVLICFVLSGKISLYSAQKHKFKFL